MARDPRIEWVGECLEDLRAGIVSLGGAAVSWRPGLHRAVSLEEG